MKDLDILDVIKYKKKYLKIIRLFHWIPVVKSSLLLKLRDDIDFNWAYVINTESNKDLCKLYNQINKQIEVV